MSRDTKAMVDRANALCLSPEEVNHRREEFNAWLRKNRKRLGIPLIPANRQAVVHDLMRAAFYAGSNYEARVAYDEDRATDCKGV
ncbi:hypothetical protein DLP3_089 [Stenotrophomonas phage vB_SmaS_DLP_3]|nr:hypothetical protein DLP3_089 [Stenotrophomonas phage vB_SmaS_DLP_3]